MFCNNFIKRVLQEQHFRQVGRLPRFFLPSAIKILDEFKLSIWYGYSGVVRCCNDGYFLNIDTCAKFFNSNTIYDKIKNLQEEHYSKEEIVDLLLPKDPGAKRLVVITKHFPKIYQIDGIAFDKTPKNTFIEWRTKDKTTGEIKVAKVNLAQYFREKYGIIFSRTEEEQPLLIRNFLD